MDDLQKRALFKDLALYSRYQTGLRAGLDKIYAKKASVVNAVQRIYDEVRKNPERFTITPDLIEIVKSGMEERRLFKQEIVGGHSPSDIQTIEPRLEEMEVKHLVERGSQKAWVALNKKLDMTLKNRRMLKDTPVASLATVAGIAFDKRQMVRGEATEHISLKAKISENLTPEQKIELVLSMREKISRPEGE